MRIHFLFPFFLFNFLFSMNQIPESLQMIKDGCSACLHPKDWEEKNLKRASYVCCCAPTCCGACVGGSCAGAGILSLIFSGGGAVGVALSVSALLCSIPLGLSTLSGCQKAQDEVDHWYLHKQQERQAMQNIDMICDS